MRWIRFTCGIRRMFLSTGTRVAARFLVPRRQFSPSFNHRLLSAVSTSGTSQGTLSTSPPSPPPSTSKLVPRGDLILTKSARERLRAILSGGERLRIEVEGGGCKGFEYKLAIDASVLEDDLVVEDEGKPVVVVDEMSLDYIRGSTVDYVEELMRASFRVLSNPLADKGCSCGTSFSLKEYPDEKK